MMCYRPNRLYDTIVPFAGIWIYSAAETHTYVQLRTSTKQFYQDFEFRLPSPTTTSTLQQKKLCTHFQ